MTTKLMTIAAALVFACGCQTRITAEKMPEQVLPVYRVASINGTNTIYVADYARASGGWYATARSPLWATEAMRGLSIGVHTNGTVTLGLEAYDRDLSTNAVVMTHELLTGSALLAEKVAAAIASCGGTTAAGAVEQMIARFVAKGGNAAKASVTCADGSCTVTDGTVTEVCTDCLPR